MAFIYYRPVRLADTDAAKVVYVAKIVDICHEAYEASLAAIDKHYPEQILNDTTAIPIAHLDIDFRRPIFWGDELKISLTPQKINETQFAIAYQIERLNTPEEVLVRATTTHICIHPQSRKRSPLPPFLCQWLERWFP